MTITYLDIDNIASSAYRTASDKNFRLGGGGGSARKEVVMFFFSLRQYGKEQNRFYYLCDIYVVSTLTAIKSIPSVNGDHVNTFSTLI